MTGLIIDNFAGGGGASTGIEAALGRAVDFAINHDAEALAMHAANHPGTIHLQEDVFKVSPKKLCAGRAVDLAWFSPDCTCHSNANGGRPVARGRRGLAGVVPKWADQVRPAMIVVENVKQFRDWGPLLPDGRPDKKRRGEHFRRWWDRLAAMGYDLDMRILVAADHGAPTTRERLFVIARCDSRPIRWPQPVGEWIPVSRVLELDASVTPLDAKKRAPATLETISRGRAKFGEDASFLISYYGNSGIHPLSRPLPTITTRDRFALILPHGMRMLKAREMARAQGFPESYALPADHRRGVFYLGNSVSPPVAEAVVRANMPREERMEVAG